MPVPDRFGPFAIAAMPSEAARIRHHLEVVGAAESKRLFYVACTRARDALVLLGPLGKLDRAPRTWSDLLELGLAHPGGAQVQSIDLDATPLDAPPLPPRPAAANPPADLARRIAPIVVPPRREVSPSSLDAAAKDLDAWQLTRHGIPDAGPRSLERDAAALLGDVLHGLLEDAVLDDPTAIARWSARAAEEGLSPDAVGAGAAQLTAQLATMRGSADVAAVLDARGLPELKVAYQHGGVSVAGRIDRLVRDPVDGAWMVVDFKSGRSSPEEHRWQLLAYSAAASDVLEAHGQGRVARAAILRTRTGELIRLPDWSAADHAALDTLLTRIGAALT